MLSVEWAVHDLRLLLVIVGIAWLLALPYEGLWKETYVDEHAIQPAQVSVILLVAADIRSRCTLTGPTCTAPTAILTILSGSRMRHLRSE